MPETYEQMEARRRADYNKAHSQHQKVPKGYEHNVPCPWCGKHNNHSGLPREKGLIVDCDHCGNIMQVVKIVQKPIIHVKQCHGQAKPPYEAKDRNKWDAEQQEAARTSAVNVNIEQEDEEKRKLLAEDKDLLELFRGMPVSYVAKFVEIRNMNGRAKALQEEPGLRQRYIEQEKKKHG